MMAIKQVQMGPLMKDVLGESYVSLELRGIDRGEDLVDRRYSLVATLVESGTGVERRALGEGEELVDVAFNALVRALLREYPSLEYLHFHSFLLEGTSGTRQGPSASDGQQIARTHLKTTAQNLDLDLVLDRMIRSRSGVENDRVMI